MNELAIAHVNPNVTEGAFHGVKKHQIAGLEFAAVNLLCRCGLVFGAARQHLANRLLEHRADKAAAIEARLYCASPELVGDTQKTHGIENKL